MTRDEYLARLKQLIDEVRDQDALDFAARYEPTVHPPLTAEHMDWVGGMLEMSSMAVAMLKDVEARAATRTA